MSEYAIKRWFVQFVKDFKCIQIFENNLVKLSAQNKKIRTQTNILEGIIDFEQQ